MALNFLRPNILSNSEKSLQSPSFMRDLYNNSAIANLHGNRINQNIYGKI